VLAITSIRGLPAHPLFAHVPVVLIPLAALGAVAMLWPAVRDRIGWYVVGAVFVAGIFTQLTVSAGQSLEEYVRKTSLVREHTRMGEEIRPWVLLMFLALLGVMLLAHRTRQRSKETTVEARGRRDALAIAGVAVAVLSVVFSAVATYWIYRIGDSGAKAVWAPTQVKIDKGQGQGRDEGGG
jgi:drug/metabolite transporter (DMT)-like permease